MKLRLSYKTNVHLERFSLVKIFALKIFTPQNLTVWNAGANAKMDWVVSW